MSKLSAILIVLLLAGGTWQHFWMRDTLASMDNGVWSVREAVRSAESSLESEIATLKRRIDSVADSVDGLGSRIDGVASSVNGLALMRRSPSNDLPALEISEMRKMLDRMSRTEPGVPDYSSELGGIKRELVSISLALMDIERKLPKPSLFGR